LAEIAVVGTGYVGLVTGAVLADRKHHVICIDNDAGKIEGLKKANCLFMNQASRR